MKHCRQLSKRIITCLILDVTHRTLVLASPPAGSMGKRKPRAAPSPTPPNLQHNGNSLKHQHKHQSSSEDGGGYRTSPEDDQVCNFET